MKEVSLCELFTLKIYRTVWLILCLFVCFSSYHLLVENTNSKVINYSRYGISNIQSPRVIFLSYHLNGNMFYGTFIGIVLQ